MNKISQDKIHTPVMLGEVLEYLHPVESQSYLDVTAGFGGHAEAVLERTLNAKGATLVDRDGQAISALRSRFAETGAHILHQDYLNASRQLAKARRSFDMILADLGVSSLHLNQASRGFSIRASGPLDMRMDSRSELTAAEIVNSFTERAIAEILENFGQEPKARTIAARIVAARPLKTTDQLAHVVAGAWRGHSRIHPATRTFQALRIAVNDELSQLSLALPLWLELLAPGGRLVVISFHSLEDRIVKEFFNEHSKEYYGSDLTLLTKKPRTATTQEIASNPRARSAKLRSGRKNKNK